MEGWRDGEERENMRDAVGGGGRSVYEGSVR
jgi:hypothetical protein